MEFSEKRKPDIDYPCDWRYKIIGENIDSVLKSIDELLIHKFKYDLSPSNISRKGKYYSLNLVVKVQNEIERNLIYQNLTENEHVKIVL